MSKVDFQNLVVSSLMTEVLAMSGPNVRAIDPLVSAKLPSCFSFPFDLHSPSDLMEASAGFWV